MAEGAPYRLQPPGASLRADLEAILAMPQPGAGIAAPNAPRRPAWRVPAAVAAGVAAVAIVTTLVVRNERGGSPTIAAIGRPPSAPRMPPTVRLTPAAPLPAIAEADPHPAPPAIAKPTAGPAREDLAMARTTTKTVSAMLIRTGDAAAPRAKQDRADAIDPRSSTAALLKALAERPPARQADASAGSAGTASAVGSGDAARPAPARSAPAPVRTAAATDTAVAGPGTSAAETAELRRRRALDLILALRRQ